MFPALHFSSCLCLYGQPVLTAYISVLTVSYCRRRCTQNMFLVGNIYLPVEYMPCDPLALCSLEPASTFATLGRGLTLGCFKVGMVLIAYQGSCDAANVLQDRSLRQRTNFVWIQF